ncbi:MAG: ACT domain-containing protein [Pseudomonadota bacterium]|nr:ACT domain-containing protein [Pseudomonadota bacterium]
MENLLAVTAIGPDRTGLVKDITEAISSSGGSIKQSRMTTLGQEFAILALVSCASDDVNKIINLLELLKTSSNLAISIRKTSNRKLAINAVPYNVDIVAINQEGIVSGLADFFSSRGIEIADLTTKQYNAPHTGADMFSVQLVINLPDTININSLREDLHRYCEKRNLDEIIEPLRK